MRFLTITSATTFLVMAMSQPCPAQFENRDGSTTPGQPAQADQPAEIDPSHVSDQVFSDQGNGTFMHNKTGLVWLSNPTNIRKPNNMAEAKELVAELRSWQHGLTDGSKAGDWRLATAAEWSTASTSP